MTGRLPPGKSLMPISGKGIVQTGNQAGGHIAGGDVSVVAVAGSYNAPAPVDRDTALGRLYAKLRTEAEGDTELLDYIDQLKVFTRSVNDEKVIGLDGKLLAAGRQDQLDMAKAMKEMIYGQIRQNMFSRTYQTIYATLMGKIHEEFQTWVRPAIINGATREEIDRLVSVHVVKPVVSDMEICLDYEGAAIPEIRGLIYFLTGNCHLCWH